ncbi:MAG: M23 family metallopeptidase [Spirochaetota bacterium]
MDHSYDHLVRKKKLSVRIEQFVRRILRAIHQKGMEMQTIMFVPHSEKSILNFHLYNYTIAFAALVLIGILVLALAFSFKREPADANLKPLREEDRKMMLSLGKYHDSARELQREFDAYESALKNLYKASGMNYPQRERMAPATNDAKGIVFTYPRDAELLSKLGIRLDTSRPHLTNVYKFVDARRMLLTAMPSAWPVRDYAGQRTSGFGVRMSPFAKKYVYHKGVDLAYIQGTPIIATADGVVAYAGWLGGYGHAVIIDHKFGYRSLYAHNYRLNVVPGKRVRKGDTIAFMGKTGKTTGVHLHYEVRLGDVPVDPWSYMTTRF